MSLVGQTRPTPTPKSPPLLTSTPAPSFGDAASKGQINAVQALQTKILDDSGRYFREGLEALKANRRVESGDRFNKAVEVFLYAALNVQGDAKLQSCYSQVIETIYRIEFPATAQPPHIRALSAICGWRWSDTDFDLADHVTQNIKVTESPPANSQGAIAAGLNQQEFEPSPLDELSKLELTEEELQSLNLWREQYVLNLGLGESWQDISNRTGVSVVDLMAANPGLKEPKGKVFIPFTQNNRITALSYSRPTPANVKVVKAYAGDTVAKVATRYGADPVDVARYNGLLPNSSLGAGREIKIPWSGYTDSPARTTIAIRGRGGKTYDCSTFADPVVQKLELGLTVNEASARLGKKLTLKKNQLTVDMSHYAAFRSKGVRLIYLGFYSGKLYLVGVEYDESIKWRNLDDFQRAVATSLSLPKDWDSTEMGSKSIYCEEFDLSVSQNYAAHYTLFLSDPRVYAKMVKVFRLKQLQIEREQDRKRQTFKP